MSHVYLASLMDKGYRRFPSTLSLARLSYFSYFVLSKSEHLEEPLASCILSGSVNDHIDLNRSIFERRQTRWWVDRIKQDDKESQMTFFPNILPLNPKKAILRKRTR